MSKHALGASVPYPKADPFIEEHYRVIKALRDGTPAQAKRAMAEHLDSACDKVVSRLELLRKSTKRIDLPYLSLG